MRTVTTTRILAEKALQMTCGQQCVDWAIGMLESGKESPTLLQLAGALPPYNHFEILALCDRSLAELDIEDRPRAGVIRDYSKELLLCGLHGDMDLWEAVAIVSDLYIADGYRRDLVDFYLLYNAYNDLQLDEVQWYWDGATKQNIEQIVRDRSRVFVDEN